MRDRTVIYDSEEDDDGFSPVNSPVKGHASQAELTADHDKEGRTVENHNEDSRSTDPEFFKRIYEEQQKAMADSVPDSVRDTQVQDGSSDKGKSSDSRANNSSSFTDPTLKSVKKSALRRINANDFQNVTQVTTPSALSAKLKDVYDFSLSDEEGADEVLTVSAMLQKKVSPKGARKASKRTRDQTGDPVHVPATGPQSSPPQVSTSNFESPSLPTKKRKTARDHSMRLVPDDVDLLAIPTSQNMSEPHDQMNLEHGGLESIVSDTNNTQVASHAHPPASFFIAPPVTLTSSQKKEYLRVAGGSSEPDGEDDQQQMTALPDPKLGHRSTNTSESTIAYTTPSRFASSIEPLPILGASDGPSSNAAASSGRRTQMDKPNPRSSPDELNAHSTSRTTRGKRRMSAVDEEDELAHDSWDSDKVGNIRETRIAKTNRRGSGADQDHLGDTDADIDTSTSEKKRPKKGAKDDSMHADSWDSDNIEFPGEHYVPRPSKRRSRVVADKEEEMQRAEDSMPDTCPPGDTSCKIAADVGPVSVPSEWQEADQVAEAIAGADPEVWAALPDEIRQELMAQQQFARTSQASRTRRSGRGAEAASKLEPFQEELTQPKKRGRKKKVMSMEEAPIAIDEIAAASEEPETLPSPALIAAAKRKRGRPRKSEAPPPPSMVDEPFKLTDAPERLVVGNEEQSATHVLPVKSPADSEVPKAPAKRGRKKKAVEAPSLDVQGLGEENAHLEGDGDDFDGLMSKRAVEPLQSPVDPPAVSIEVEDRPALRDISSSGSNMLLKSGSAMDHVAGDLPTDEAEQQQEVTPEPKAKEVAKLASTPGQQGKVPLRVGLSKRSRIAPLLKIIRK